jgi:hypothetical protein
LAQISACFRSASILNYLSVGGLNVMHVLSVKCWFTGHEDFVRAREQRVFLSCIHCGRETHGWDIAGQAERESTPIAELSREARVVA